MKIIMTVSLILATTLLTACASLNNSLTPEKTLQNKVSSVIHANPDNVVITNKQTQGEHVEFTASVLDKTYHCHYTATLLKQTDTICE